MFTFTLRHMETVIGALVFSLAMWCIFRKPSISAWEKEQAELKAKDYYDFN
jgi:hypothetical protein